MFQEFKINNLEQFPKDLNTLLNQQRKIINEITKILRSSYEKVLKPLTRPR